jgi:GNAT superfamily N-acetyltransferase
MQISQVAEDDLEDLLPLMRAYCDFYRSSPSDAALLGVSRSLIGDPRCEGVQFLARGDAGEAIGFATVLWSWDTTLGGRIGVMSDLFVSARRRGEGAAEALIAACRERCRQRGVARLTWQTAPGNLRAQALYDRVGAVQEAWLEYWLATH